MLRVEVKKETENQEVFHPKCNGCAENSTTASSDIQTVYVPKMTQDTKAGRITACERLPFVFSREILQLALRAVRRRLQGHVSFFLRVNFRTLDRDPAKRDVNARGK